MNKKTILITLLIVILIGVIGISAYFLKGKELLPTLPKISEGDTLNWKVYRNEKYGFEFKYPEEYDQSQECKIEEISNGIELGEGRLRIEIVKSEDLSLVNHVNKFVNEQKKELGILGLSEEELAERNMRIEAEKIFVGSNEGFRVDLPGRPAIVIFLSNDGKIYQISYGSRGVTGCLGYAQYEGTFKGDASKVPSELDIFEQIPFTFRLY